MTQNHLSLRRQPTNKRKEICRLSFHCGRIVVDESNGWEDETCKRSAGEKRKRRDHENNFFRNLNETHYFNLKSHEDSRDSALSLGTLQASHLFKLT